VPETPHRKRKVPGTAPEPGEYTLVATAKDKPALKCGICEEILPLRSNVAIADEYARLSDYLIPETKIACPNVACAMLGSPVATNYQKFGTTPSGTPRYRCKTCMKTFAVGGKSTKRQRQTHKNIEIFRLLVTQNSISSIVENTDLDKKTVYGKVNFLHRQSVLFAGDRERQLGHGFELKKMYVATDRQSLIVNWSSRKDRKTVILNAIATADLESGYVFGMHLNFDEKLNQDLVEDHAKTILDEAYPQPFRHYARVWLKSDYTEAIATSTKGKKHAKKVSAIVTGDDGLTADIKAEYETAIVRDDIEESDEKDDDVNLPVQGMQLHEQYTMYGHFKLMAEMFREAPKVRFYMDQDSGIRAAFMNAFHQRVRERTADAWYVKVLKDATIDEKIKSVRESMKKFNAYKASNPDLEEWEVELLMVKEEMKKLEPFGKWDDRWLTHPFPNRSESDKRVCWLTNLNKGTFNEPGPGDYVEDQVARLYKKATLHAVDRFFMKVRRKVRYAERGIPSGAADRRIWHGYSPYKPHNLTKALEIYRVYYNYCDVGEDGQTPAMRLGLAKGKIRVEDIVYFVP